MRFSIKNFSSFKVVHLGSISYRSGLSQQEKYVNLCKASKSNEKPENFLLCLEHTPVYTVGVRSKQYSAEEEQRLRDLGADFHRTSRGGLITFHGPGQLVMYPIFDLRRITSRPLGVRAYVEKLEQTIIDCATKEFGIGDVGRTENTGVWVEGSRKLAALGIAVSHGVSHHGLALNCNTDLTWFDQIVGCGIAGLETTSLSVETSRDVSVAEAQSAMVRSFADNFECEIEEPELESVALA